MDGTHPRLVVLEHVPTMGVFRVISRWREILARNDNTCGESKSQNSHESLLDLTFLIAATDPKAPVY
jgi:hypothetical protein